MLLRVELYAVMGTPKLELLCPRVVHLSADGVNEHLKGCLQPGKGSWVATLVRMVLLGKQAVCLQQGTGAQGVKGQGKASGGGHGSEKRVGPSPS